MPVTRLVIKKKPKCSSLVRVVESAGVLRYLCLSDIAEVCNFFLGRSRVADAESSRQRVMDRLKRRGDNRGQSQHPTWWGVVTSQEGSCPVAL